MKKLLVLAAALLTLSMGGIADAADMARPAYKAAPPPAPVYSWTGCYVGAGGGYGMFNLDHDTVTEPPTNLPAGTLLSSTVTTGGRGYLGTVGVGCDIQVSDRWLIGAFADWDWTGMKGQHQFNCPGNCPLPSTANVGEIKERGAWSVGGRIGYLVMPSLLTYFDAGFTSARFSQVNILGNQAAGIGIGGFTGAILPANTFNGYFIGGGTEYAIGWFPGLFWKNEYRFADYRTQNISVQCSAVVVLFGCGAIGPLGAVERIHPYVQTVRSELVWRFNMGGPVRAAY